MGGAESAEVTQSESGFVTGQSTCANEAKVMGSTPEKAVTSVSSLLEDCTRNYHRSARGPKMTGWLGMWVGEVMVMNRD